MKTFKTVTVVIIITLLMKIMGFSKDLLIAYRFGSGIETDAYFIALTTITLIATILTAGISATLVPILFTLEKKEGKRGKITRTNNFLSIMFLTSLFVMIFSWFGTPVIVKVMAPGFSLEQLNLAISLTRIGLPVIALATVKGIYKAYLESELKFIEANIAEIPQNIIMIIFLVWFSNKLNIEGLMISLVIGTVGTLITSMFFSGKSGFKHIPMFDFKDHYFIKMTKLLPPVLMTVAMGDIKTIIDRALASTLVEGSISALSYGNRLKSLVLGIFIASITTVIFPILSKDATKDTYRDFKKTFINGINAIIIITVPTMFGLIVLSEPIIKVAFERGAFTSESSAMTEGALIFYSIGLPAMGVRNFTSRAYHSLNNTKVPMKNSMVSIVLNVIFSVSLMGFMGHRGLALGTSLSSIISAILLIINIRKLIGSIQYKVIIICGIKSFFASLFMSFAVYYSYIAFFISYIYESFILGLISLLSMTVLGIIVFFISLTIMKTDELKWIRNLMLSKIKRR